MPTLEEMKHRIGLLSKEEQIEVNYEIKQLMLEQSMQEEAATGIIYQKHINPAKEENLTIDSKLDKILERIDRSEKNLSNLLSKKANYYIDKGFTEEESWKMAKAEILFDVPDTDKLEKNLQSAKKESISNNSTDEASDFLSQL